MLYSSSWKDQHLGASLFLIFVSLIENSAWNVGLKFSKVLHHGYLQENWDGIVWTDVAITVHLLCSSNIWSRRVVTAIMDSALCSAFQSLSSSHVSSVKHHGVPKFKIWIISILTIWIYLYKMPFQRKYCIQVATEMVPNKSIQMRLQNMILKTPMRFIQYVEVIGSYENEKIQNSICCNCIVTFRWL